MVVIAAVGGNGLVRGAAQAVLDRKPEPFDGG